MSFKYNKYCKPIDFFSVTLISFQTKQIQANGQGQKNRGAHILSNFSGTYQLLSPFLWAHIYLNSFMGCFR